MNTSTYNQALNQAMPWTEKLFELEVEQEVETNTEYDKVIVSDSNKGSTIL